MKNHFLSVIFLYTVYGPKDQKHAIVAVRFASECDYESGKWIKYQNHVRNMFRDTKLPLANDMRHWNDLFWSF